MLLHHNRLNWELLKVLTNISICNSTAGIYEVPEDIKDKVVSAVISPSSTETREGRGNKRTRALDPAADTGVDTQQLVREDHDC